MLPYPEQATASVAGVLISLARVGLGQPGDSPASLVLLGIFPMLTFGAAGAAQKLLVLGLGILAFKGAYNLVSDLVDRTGRVAAGVDRTCSARSATWDCARGLSERWCSAPPHRSSCTRWFD